jgi:hypothetical protein
MDERQKWGVKVYQSVEQLDKCTSPKHVSINNPFQLSVANRVEPLQQEPL